MKRSYIEHICKDYKLTEKQVFEIIRLNGEPLHLPSRFELFVMAGDKIYKFGETGKYDKSISGFVEETNTKHLVSIELNKLNNTYVKLHSKTVDIIEKHNEDRLSTKYLVYLKSHYLDILRFSNTCKLYLAEIRGPDYVCLPNYAISRLETIINSIPADITKKFENFLMKNDINLAKVHGK